MNEVPHCEASPFPILINFRRKRSPQGPVNVNDHVTEPNSTTGNMIVLCI